MEGKWLAAVALLIAAVAGCTREPPPYVSRYTTPPSFTQPPPLPPGSSFVDDFERSDTPRGLGGGWDMRGADDGGPIVPVATGAFIRDGHYVSSDDSGVYAVHDFRSTVRRVGTEGRWTRIGDGGYEAVSMGIAASDSLDGDLLELAVVTTGWTVSMRRGGATSQVVVSGKFDPPLELDRTYRFEMDAADGTVTVKVPGLEKKTKLGTIGLLGERAFWQHSSPPAELPIGAKFCIDMVWAAEQDQPLSPIPAAN